MLSIPKQTTGNWMNKNSRMEMAISDKPEWIMNQLVIIQ